MVFKSFVRKTYLLLDYARTGATLANTVVRVKWDRGAEKIFLIGSDALPSRKRQEVPIPKKVHLKSQRQEFIFYPDGTMEEFKIIISGEDGKFSVISSRGFDGKIKIEPKG